MKLLFDHNLSPKLVRNLADLFPDSSHLFLLNLDESDDTIVFDFARQNNFTIVTKDADFNDLGLVRGFPPKIIWMRRGNCSTGEIEKILRNHFADISEFYQSKDHGVLLLF